MNTISSNYLSISLVLSLCNSIKTVNVAMAKKVSITDLKRESRKKMYQFLTSYDV